MPQIEVIPNSTSISAPGWAYVPDNGYDPSKVAIQPSGARKRAARASALAIGDTTTRQQTAVLKHLAELDKDSHRDVQIAIPAKQKESANKSKLPHSPQKFWIKTCHVVGKKVTQNVRRILISQKTFANHLADEEAGLALQDQHTPAPAAPRTGGGRAVKIASSQKQHSATTALPSHIANSQPSKSKASVISVSGPIQASGASVSNEDEPLLKIHLPSAPSDAVLEALVSGPPLSYNGARAAPSTGRPQRHFCEICGYWGTIKCMKCGVRVCGLECKNAHADGRCLLYTWLMNPTCISYMQAYQMRNAVSYLRNPCWIHDIPCKAWKAFKSAAPTGITLYVGPINIYSFWRGSLKQPNKLDIHQDEISVPSGRMFQCDCEKSLSFYLPLVLSVIEEFQKPNMSATANILPLLADYPLSSTNWITMGQPNSSLRKDWTETATSSVQVPIFVLITTKDLTKYFCRVGTLIQTQSLTRTKGETFSRLHITLLQAPFLLSSIICIEWLPRKGPLKA